MAEEARDVRQDDPARHRRVVVAVAVIYAFLPAVALSAMPVVNGETQLALPKEEGGYADDPVLGVVENMDLGALQGAAEVYVGHPRRDDPVHRHERGPDRRLAADLLDGPAPPAAGAAAGAAPEVPHPLRRDHRLRRRGLRGDPARPGRLPRRDLRLRGDALVHDRPLSRDQAADHAARRRAALAQPGHAARGRAGAAAARGLRRARHRDRADRRHRARPARARLRARSGSRSGSRSTWSTGAARASR